MFCMRNQQFDRLLHQLEYLNENLHVVAQAVQRTEQVLREIKQKLPTPTPPPPSLDVTSFIITQLAIQGDSNMALLPIAPGQSPEFTATPSPAGAVPATSPTWTSSDTTNAPVTVDSTGLIATVAIPTTAVVGTSFTLQVSYTNSDGTVATGSLTETIVAAVTDIVSFSIAQSK